MRLVPCPSCRLLIRPRERSCPHCDASVTKTMRPLVTATASVVLGLSMTACYGAPPTREPLEGPTKGAPAAPATVNDDTPEAAKTQPADPAPSAKGAQVNDENENGENENGDNKAVEDSKPEGERP